MDITRSPDRATVVGADPFLRGVTEFTFGCGLVLGFLLLFASMGENPVAPASASAVVQLLPLSGFVVTGAALFGLNSIRTSLKRPRYAAVSFVIIALLFTAVAAWIGLARPQTGFLASVLMIVAVPPFVAGCTSLIRQRAG